MDPMTRFVSLLAPEQRSLFTSLNTPYEIQSYLDSIPYSAESTDRCPLEVLRDGKGHCLDGALLAAAALRRLGDPPLVVDLLPENDDDHVLTIFKRHGHYGALAKSNYAGLRYREPVYRTLRELIMTYFDVFYNTKGEKTLRGYTAMLNLKSLDRLEWLWRSDGIDQIVQRMEKQRKHWILTPEMRASLSPVDPRSYEAGLIQSDPAGLYQPQ